jgi:beta-lactamase class A
MKNKRVSRVIRSAAEPKWLLVLIFFVAGGLFGGLGIYLTTAALTPQTARLHFASKDQNFINPVFTVDPGTQQNFSTVSNDLQLKVAGIVSQAKNAHDVQEVGIYFQDLDAGTWLSLNSNMSFSPGRLLKLPILISYYKLAETTPTILDKNLQAPTKLVKSEDLYSAPDTLVPGASYTVSDLLERMIAESDDNAARLLFMNIDKTSLNEIFSELGIDFTEDLTTPDFISLKRYSLFFRLLYRASYLTPDYSQKALELLSRNPSQSLLEASLPQSIQFVNRIGARSYTQNKSSYIETYECDIVYLKNHHDYLLCAVVDAKTSSATKALFNAVGKAIYADMSYRYSQ